MFTSAAATTASSAMVTVLCWTMVGASIAAIGGLIVLLARAGGATDADLDGISQAAMGRDHE
jgi:hypothetical protein